MALEDLKRRYGELQNLLNTPLSQTQGGLLGNIPQGTILGASLIGQGVQGRDPFSAFIPAFAQTAQLQKYLTPKKEALKSAYDPQKGENVFATESEIIAKGLKPVQTGNVTRFNPETGSFEIIPAGMVKQQEENFNQASIIQGANDQFNFVGNRIKELVQQTPTGTVGALVSAIEGVGDQLSQAAQQLGISTGYKSDNSDLLNSAIQKATGLKPDAENWARVKSQYINFGYILARMKEPDNPRLSDADIARQLDRLSVGQSRDKQLAALDEILMTENREANIKYKTLTGMDLPIFSEKEKKKLKKEETDPLGLGF
jgi:hypothetical protein